jgi:hypothetical protein
MNMGAGRCSGDSVPKGDKRNPGLTKKTQQRLAFFTVWVERHVHGVAMIESQAVMRRRLT